MSTLNGRGTGIYGHSHRGQAQDFLWGFSKGTLPKPSLSRGRLSARVESEVSMARRRQSSAQTQQRLFLTATAIQ